MEKNISKKRSITVQPSQPSNFPPSTAEGTNQEMTAPSKIKNQQQPNTFYPSQTAKLDRFVKNFSTRASGKINCISPSTEIKSTKTQVETMEGIVKQHLKTLNYREKLTNIEGLLKNCFQLCQQFGYFYITCAMLFYDPFSQVKLSVWVHPDTRVTKCLHPILQKTEEQKQIQFITHLKLLIKQFFPTIYLGNGRTFDTLREHITELQSQLFYKSKSSRAEISTSLASLPERDQKNGFSKFYDPHESAAQLTLKKTQKKLSRQFLDEKTNQKIKSKNSEETLKKDKSKFRETYSKISSYKLQEGQSTPQKQIPHSRSKLENFIKHHDQSSCKSQNDEEQTRQQLQKTMEIEDELNNLFGSNDFGGGFYDRDRVSEATNKKSLIQRIQTQFDDLF